MVQNEYEYLIHLLRCAIHDQKPEELPPELSFETVFKCGLAHDVANLAFYAVEQLEKLPEKALYDRWRLRRDLALSRDINQQFAREEIVQELNKQGIPYLELQGTVLKKLYPRSEYRTMSDLDFIVKKDHLSLCGDILSSLGYACTTQEDWEIDGRREPNIFVEFHTDYFPINTDYYDSMGRPFSMMNPTEEDLVHELYIYNILHVAKHYFSSGCGIRRVLDIYYLDQAFGEKLNRNRCNTVFQNAKIQEFAEDLSALASEWFGEGQNSNGNRRIADFILQSDLHGNRENYVNRKLADIGGKGVFSKKTKLAYLLTRLFPGDRIMLNRYPILQRWRILYPICWIHRGIRMLFGKNRKASVKDLHLIVKAKQDERDRL